MECVPNFSEGRDTATVFDIAQATQIEGVRLLDVHLDSDHNRSVLTLVGEPDALVRAVFAAIERAVAVLDLREHRGIHPRIGVADVVPFVPVTGVSREDCVLTARTLGQQVGAELDVPVFLYEWAATRAEFRNLADLRRLYERARVSGVPLLPDYGPADAHPRAGAVAIGARAPLVALNCFLAESDLEAARRIAARTRVSGGGPVGVKALGLPLHGASRVQVSMNITQTDQAPPHVAVERVREIARAEGTALAESELVGLLPLDSVLRAAAHALGLPSLNARQILELAAEEWEGRLELDGFLDELASNASTPGGGAASALVGALGAALGSMVCNLTVGRTKYAAVEPQMRDALQETERLRGRLRELMEADEQAYSALMAQYKLPRDTQEQKEHREAAVESALRHAADVPLETAKTCVEVLRWLEPVARDANANVISDAGAGAFLSEAAARSALLNVRVNASLMNDRVVAASYLEALDFTDAEATALTQRIMAVVHERMER
jgi:glutamate formiminotransferase/formiminotetrahydrofolate cyclodeaminase